MFRTLRLVPVPHSSLVMGRVRVRTGPVVLRKIMVASLVASQKTGLIAKLLMDAGLLHWVFPSEIGR